MSLYSNITIKEWLTLHCVTKDVNDLFRKALKDNDEPMAVLTLAELLKRGDSDLVEEAIIEAVDTKCFASRHFATVFTNALTNLANRDPMLNKIARAVYRKGSWPESSEELIKLICFDNSKQEKPKTIKKFEYPVE